MKTCSKCKGSKSPSEFSKHRGTKDGLQYYCKACMKVVGKPHVGKVTIKERKGKMYIDMVKSKSACISCGESHPACLDFHHKDPSTKELAISWMAYYSVDRIKQEIAKCEILCSNCHRKLHYNKLAT